MINTVQYAVTVALNYEEINWKPQGVSNIKPFINKYNWKGINYPSKIDDLKMFQKIIWQLLLMFCILKKKNYVQLISQELICCEKQIILLMIPNNNKKRLALSSSKQTIYITKMRNTKTSW